MVFLALTIVCPVIVLKAEFWTVWITIRPPSHHMTMVMPLVTFHSLDLLEQVGHAPGGLAW